jgi:GTP-binding protein HflX
LRKVVLPSRLEIVLSDTVGFVRKLPHELVAAFRATLEEVREANLLLHLIDISNPQWREQAEAVREVLGELGVLNVPCIDVHNKADLLPAALQPQSGDSGQRSALLISAKQEVGLSALIGRISESLSAFSVHVELKIPYGKAGLVSRLQSHGRISSQVFESDGIRLEVELPKSIVHSLRQFLLCSENSG